MDIYELRAHHLRQRGFTRQPGKLERAPLRRLRRRATSSVTSLPLLTLLLSVIILAGGPLQLIPAVRKRWPKFHRIVGRSYMIAAIITAIVGLYMMFQRDIGGLSTKVGFLAQGVLIAWFASNAFRYARARKIAIHRRWALRLFLAASAVWFFRVILMIWVLLTGGIGIDFTTGKGPFIDFMSIGQYLPLVILEWYFLTQTKGSSRSRGVLAGFLFVATALTALGVGLATIGMWFPME